MTRWLGENRRWTFVFLFVLSVLFSWTVLVSEFRGEDEMMFLNNTQKVIRFLKTGNGTDLRVGMLEATNPPASSLFPLISVLFFGKNEVAFRLPHVLIWAYASILVFQMVLRMEGTRSAALLAGGLTAVSGQAGIYATANAHGFFAVMFLLFFYFNLPKLPDCSTVDGGRKFAYSHLVLFLGFLAFNTSVMIVPFYSLISLSALPQDGSFRQRYGSWLRWNIIFAGLYLVYYLLFVGLPWYWYETGFYHQPMGFHARYLSRVGGSHLNIDSFVQNLRSLNGYFLPFVSWILLGVGVRELLRRAPWIFWSFAFYLFAISFWMTKLTMSHFLPFFTGLTPFFCMAIFPHRGSITTWRLGVAALLIVGVASWALMIHVVQYKEVDYPRNLLRKTQSEIFTFQNIHRPLRLIASDLRLRLPQNRKAFSLVDGAIVHYFNDSRMVPAPSLGRNDRGERVWSSPQDQACFGAALISSRDAFDPDLVCEVVDYPGSDLALVIFKE